MKAKYFPSKKESKNKSNKALSHLFVKAISKMYKDLFEDKSDVLDFRVFEVESQWFLDSVYFDESIKKNDSMKRLFSEPSYYLSSKTGRRDAVHDELFSILRKTDSKFKESLAPIFTTFFHDHFLTIRNELLSKHDRLGDLKVFNELFDLDFIKLYFDHLKYGMNYEKKIWKKIEGKSAKEDFYTRIRHSEIESIKISEKNALNSVLKWGDEISPGFKRTKAEIEKGKESYDFYIYQKRVGGKEFSDINEAQDYLNSVGFRGIQFGNTVSDSQREAALFRLAEAVSDFKSVIDVEDFTFNKKLAIAFGARGKSRAIAHYEPALDVINITKKGLSGGALAHEWAHAFDKKTKNIRDEFLNLESVREMRKRMHSVGKEQPNDDYWNSDEEMFARIFEKYVDRKMKKAKRNNSFLVGGINHELWPTNEEMDKALDEIDGLLKFKK